ncbi:D-alanyl-D-alanine carboxypeptidase [Eubacteriaceae bacterium ES2]|nr:D-alanyl-D-alanine carboxypeptidase [Eubacteriaceae bacterium ES2]
MKRRIAILVFVSMLIMSGSAFAETLPTFGADEGVIVFELNSGDIVTMQNETKQMYPASTTKLLTALVAVENGDMNENITLGDEVYDIDSDSSVADLASEEVISMRDLLYGLLLPSGNDAANVIAVNVGRKILGNAEATDDESYDAFIAAMNQKAQSLGMTGSHFTNPHGLQDSDHYTTPEDMLKLAQAAFNDQTVASITRTKMHEVTTNKSSHTWYNTNMLLYASFDEFPEDYQTLYGLSGDNADFNGYANSGKTGTTEEAGSCLVFQAEGNGKKIIAVIFNSTEDLLYSEANQTIDTVIKDYDFITWTEETDIKNFYKEVKVDNYHIFDGSKLDLQTSEPLITLVRTDESDNYTAKISWDSSKVTGGEDLIAINEDIEEGEQVGEIEVYNGDSLVETAPLYANNKIAMRSFIDYPIIYWYVTIVLILLLLALMRIAFVHFMRKNNIRYKKIKIKGATEQRPTRKSAAKQSAARTKQSAGRTNRSSADRNSANRKNSNASRNRQNR